MNQKVDEFLGRAKKWQPEMEELRKIALECDLIEELKWGKPCYTYNAANIIIIQGFKEYCALLFIKGTLLQDSESLLVNVGENSQSAKQARFTELSEITRNIASLKAYIYEAIEVEKAGLKVEYKRKPESIPEELQRKLDDMPAFSAAFTSLTPGRQRAYILYFSAPKQSKTREARIEKSIAQILAGKGLNDR